VKNSIERIGAVESESEIINKYLVSRESYLAEKKSGALFVSRIARGRKKKEKNY